MPNNPCDIVDVDKSTVNDKWKEAYSLERGKLNEMDTFREMMDAEWKSGLFHCFPLHLIF